MTHHSRGASPLLKFPALYDNKYVFFYSLWPCYFIPNLNLIAYTHMLFCFTILIIMAGFGFDDDFFLSGLMQEGHDNVFRVINSSSSYDENYDGLLEYACKLGWRNIRLKFKGRGYTGRCQARCQARCVEYADS